MKITVATPARRYEAELDESKGEAIFLQVVGLISCAASSGSSVPSIGGKARSMGRPVVPSSEEGTPAAADKIPAADPGANTEGPADGKDPKGAPEKVRDYARGFLLIRCQSCGHIRALHSPNTIEIYRCPECKARTPLQAPLRKAIVNCECGNDARYRTNITDDAIDVPCVKCGTPVACEYNERAGAYTTIREIGGYGLKQHTNRGNGKHPDPNTRKRGKH